MIRSGSGVLETDLEGQRSPTSQDTATSIFTETGRFGSPTNAPASHASAAGASGVEREPHSCACGATGGGGQAAANNISCLSIDSHHGCMSHHSRCSTAATMATTVVHRASRHHDPMLGSAAPLSELPGGGSGEATTLVTAAAGSTHGHAGSAVGGSTGEDGGSTRLLRCMSSRVNNHNSRSTMAAASLAMPMEGAAAGDDGGTRLPPRLIVFHPDGKSFGIGVDKAREAELAAAAATAASQQRHRQQHAAAVVGPSGVRPPLGSVSASGDGDAPSPYVGYCHIYARQKIALVLLLLVDVVYLAVLLILRLVWGDNKGAPTNLNGIVNFFVGSHPDTTSISYLAGSLFTNLIALYGTLLNFPSIITLFIVWSIVLGAFAILEMPLFFMILRLLLLILAFQLRFSMARIRHMLPTASFGGWLTSAGRGVASAGGATWNGVSYPFRSLARWQRQPSPPPQERPAGITSSHRLSGHQHLPIVGGPSPAPQSPIQTATAQPAAARFSVLFRAALMRIMSEQLREQQRPECERWGEQDVESRASATGEAAEASGGSQAAAGSVQSASSSRHVTSASTARAAAGMEQQGSGLEQMYSQVMRDIAAVAVAPNSASTRRRQRWHERDSRRHAATASSSDNDAPQGGSGQATATVAAASRDSSGSQQETAVSRVAVAAQQSAAGSGGSPPILQEPVVLLSYHPQHQQLMRQQAQHQAQAANVVPMVSLEAPPRFSFAAVSPGAGSG